MKTRIFTLFLALAASAGTMFAEIIEHVQIGDLYYNLDTDNQTAEVVAQYAYATIDCTKNYSGLTAATIPSSVEYDAVTYSVTSIGKEAFRLCSDLASVVIPNSVASIGYGAFVGCSGLLSLEIPQSVTYMDGLLIDKEYDYHQDGTQLKIESLKIYNPNLVLGENEYYKGYNYPVFMNTMSLTNVYVPAQCFFSNTPDEYMSSDGLFPRKLETVEFTGGELSDMSFWVLGNSYKAVKIVDLSATANTTLSDEAFKGFYNLQTLKLPANLTHIGYMSLAECVKLQEIVIPASVTEIDDRAFENCRSLKSITFGGSANPAPGRMNAPAAASQLQRIGNWAFYNCHELQNLEIPEGVTEIGDAAFYGCTYLENLSLPSSVQSIGDNCFALCSKMKRIVVNSLVPPTIQAKTFYDVNRHIPVYVPDEVVAQYENDPLWGEFDIQGVSQMPEGVENVQSDNVQCTKIFRDGQVLILRGDKIYTVTGQEVR